MAVDNYVRSEFKITATIDGVVFKDVVAISATFGLNSIPTATLTVASGTEVNSKEVATVHKSLKDIKTRSPAKVVLTVITTDGQKDKMPAGDYVIFEGYYAGVGYERSQANCTYTLHLVHWIDDLNCSSVLNGNWFVGAPHDMAAAASNFSLSSLAGGDGDAIIAPILDNNDNICNFDNLNSDLWENVIKPMLLAMANMNHPMEQGDGNDTGAAASGFGGGDNKAAQDALKRMPGSAPIPGTLPLEMGDGGEPFTIPHCVNLGLSKILTTGLGYSSFWGKVTGEIGPAFLFGISPSVEFANVIPHFGGLSTPYITINSDEYNYAGCKAGMATLIESVDVFYSEQGNAGDENGGTVPQIMDYTMPWGRYPEKNQDFRGHILVRDPPVWLMNVTPQELCTPGTTLPPVGDAHVPQHGSDAPSNNAKRAQEAENEIKTTGIINKFCEHWYKSAVLGQRMGELSGKLRFDIAPGSTVQIEAPDSAIGREMWLNLYATVTSVSYVINAEQHTAGTSFTLINVRDGEENKNPLLTAAKPPLYQKAWSGGPLAVKS
jgi:hypothetical protein